MFLIFISQSAKWGGVMAPLHRVDHTVRQLHRIWSFSTKDYIMTSDCRLDRSTVLLDHSSKAETK